MRGFLNMGRMGARKSTGPVYRPASDSYAFEVTDSDDDAGANLPAVIKDIADMAQSRDSGPSYPVQQQTHQAQRATADNPEPATGNQATEPRNKTQGTDTVPVASAQPIANTQEFIPGSRVTKQQYLRPDVRDTFDAAAAQDDAPLVVYPLEKAYLCPCELETCKTAYETWEETVAGALNHSPELRGTPVEIAVGVWTEDSPQRIILQVVRQTSLGTDPARQTQSNRSAWPRNTPLKPLNPEDTYKALQKPEVLEKVQQLQESAAVWREKQPIGTVHLFSDYDLTKWGKSKNRGKEAVRKYSCPETSCNDEAFARPGQILDHIKEHPGLAQQHAQCYSIVINQFTGLPDFKVSISNRREREQRTDDSQPGERSKRARQKPALFDAGGSQPSKPRAKQQGVITEGLVRELVDGWKSMSAEKVATAQETCDVKIEAQNHVHAAELAKEKAEAREQLTQVKLEAETFKLEAEKSKVSFMQDVMLAGRPAASSTTREEDQREARRNDVAED